MCIKYFDMFSGIGGFRSGLEAAGGFTCIGYCEIDKYAQIAYKAIYDTKGEFFYEDARTIEPESMPEFDLLCGGFPCQAFSVAGRRGGFDDSRGTLFFEIARIARVKRPAFLCLENVPGLLSHDKGRTFQTIVNAISELGYDVAWQVLNSKNFGVPQSRKRVYIIGYLRERCPGEILSFAEANAAATIQLVGGREGSRIYADSGTGITITGCTGGLGGKSGLYHIALPIKVATKEGFQEAHPGDSIDLSYPNLNTRRGRVGKQVAHTVLPGAMQGCFFIDLNEDAKISEQARCVTTRQDNAFSNHKGEKSGIFVEAPRAVINPAKKKTRQNGRRIKEPEEPMFTLTVTDRHGVIHHGRVRKLTPLECWRLQGFSDVQYEKAKNAGISESQLYKLAGNAVSVPVITALGKKIKRIYEEMEGERKDDESIDISD